MDGEKQFAGYGVLVRIVWASKGVGGDWITPIRVGLAYSYPASDFGSMISILICQLLYSIFACKLDHFCFYLLYLAILQDLTFNGLGFIVYIILSKLFAF